MDKEFSYTARTEAGQELKGRLRTGSRQQAARQLAEQGYFVTSLEEATGRSSLWDGLLRLWHGREVMLLCRELAVMTGAGMTVNDALALLLEQEKKTARKQLLGYILGTVNGGGTLSEALQARPDYFSETFLYMVSVGEISGRLSELLDKLGNQLEKGDAAKEKLLTILLYPFILLLVTMSVLLFMLNFVLPAFGQLFQELGSELPLPTRILLQLGEWCEAFGALLPLVLLLPLLILFFAWQQKSLRLWLELLLLRLPGIGELLRYTELLRFAGTLSVLLSSGVVVDKALEILSQVSSSLQLRQRAAFACEEVRRGRQLSQAMVRLGLFPDLLLGLLRAGEATGTMDEALERIALLAEREADNRAERLKIMLEPALLLVLGSIIGSVVLAIALPVLESLTLFSY